MYAVFAGLRGEGGDIQDEFPTVTEARTYAKSIQQDFDWWDIIDTRTMRTIESWKRPDNEPSPGPKVKVESVVVDEVIISVEDDKPKKVRKTKKK